jgi:hypothetical protein
MSEEERKARLAMLRVTMHHFDHETGGIHKAGEKPAECEPCFILEELDRVTAEREKCDAIDQANHEKFISVARERDAALEQVRVLTRLASFFRSVFKSGESWTETCEREYLAATAKGEPRE